MPLPEHLHRFLIIIIAALKLVEDRSRLDCQRGIEKDRAVLISAKVPSAYSSRR